MDTAKAERLASDARASLSEYCSSQCKAYCCRKGYLVLTSAEADLVAGPEREALERDCALTSAKNGMLALDLSAGGGACPSLRAFRCAIHASAGRPRACKEFPIFVWSGQVIRVSQRCPAVKENLLYPYLAQLKKMGCRISYGTEIF